MDNRQSPGRGFLHVRGAPPNKQERTGYQAAFPAGMEKIAVIAPGSSLWRQIWPFNFCAAWVMLCRLFINWLYTNIPLLLMRINILCCSSEASTRIQQLEVLYTALLNKLPITKAKIF